MTIDWPDVTEAELFKQHAAMQASFHAFLDLRQHAFSRIAEQWYAIEHLGTSDLMPV